MDTEITPQGYIDITPTWDQLVDQMLEVIVEEKDLYSKRTDAIHLEFHRMAQAADKWNEYARTRNRQID